MRILLVGSGAREHALAWKLSTDPATSELLVLPGNPGMAALGSTIGGVAPTDGAGVTAAAREHRADLVVIGPEAPLAAGLVDHLTGAGVPAFGPLRSAARLESSKSFAKDVMRRAGVPTAMAASFDTPGAAHRHLAAADGPFVVKADGLAAGKGVLVTEDRAEARAWIDRCFAGGFGPAGASVVIEEYLDGPELSVFAICDGSRSVTLQPARDYKRLEDGDRGPNTGGMGSFSPVDLPAGLVETVETDVIKPTLRRMADDGCPYVGFLYVGLALTRSGPKVVEFNCRLGDPETQVVLPRMATDLVPILHSAALGALGGADIAWKPEAAVNVVLAATGYPDAPRAGDVISGLDDLPAGVLVFHAGTATEGDAIVTAGGRILSVVALAPDLGGARARAYAAVDGIRFAGRRFRTDIGT